MSLTFAQLCRPFISLGAALEALLFCYSFSQGRRSSPAALDYHISACEVTGPIGRGEIYPSENRRACITGESV